MLILGIETATPMVSVAIGGHEGVLGLFETSRGRRHAETLVPAIEFVCKQADVEISEFGAIAVDVGPGLFTGMRVGLAAGKAMAQALRLPMIGISSLDLLAFPLRHSDRTIAAVIDARKGEVFYAFYRPVPGGCGSPHAAGRLDDLVADLMARGQNVLWAWRVALPRRDRGRPALRLRRAVRVVPLGCAAGAVGPRSRAARGLGEPVGDPADVPAGTRRADQLEHPRMSVLAKFLGRTDDGLDIEPLRKKHLGEIMPIEQASYPRPWTPGVFQGELELARRGERYYIVARDGSQLVGYAGLLFAIDDAHVTNIAVAAEHRRRGVATRLLAELAWEAIARDCHALTLGASATPAQALREFGFVPAGAQSTMRTRGRDRLWCNDCAGEYKAPGHAQPKAPMSRRG
jgi:tRNA threonylcarbamoyladenosine biosynthesis protein TsaB